MPYNYRRLSAGKRQNQNQGGGTKKQGLPAITNMSVLGNKAARFRGGGEHRNYFFLINQLSGGVGRMYSANSGRFDGARGTPNGPGPWGNNGGGGGGGGSDSIDWWMDKDADFSGDYNGYYYLQFKTFGAGQNGLRQFQIHVASPSNWNLEEAEVIMIGAGGGGGGAYVDGGSSAAAAGGGGGAGQYRKVQQELPADEWISVQLREGGAGGDQYGEDGITPGDVLFYSQSESFIRTARRGKGGKGAAVGPTDTTSVAGNGANFYGNPSQGGGTGAVGVNRAFGGGGGGLSDGGGNGNHDGEKRGGDGGEGQTEDGGWGNPRPEASATSGPDWLYGGGGGGGGPNANIGGEGGRGFELGYGGGNGGTGEGGGNGGEGGNAEANLGAGGGGAGAFGGNTSNDAGFSGGKGSDGYVIIRWPIIT